MNHSHVKHSASRYIEGQLTIPRNNRWQLKQVPGIEYRVIRASRTLPCRHGSIRIKIKEPGLHSRLCNVCNKRFHYVLELNSFAQNALMMRWVDAKEAAEISAASLLDCDQGAAPPEPLA